jgi:hypothetical protein
VKKVKSRSKTQFVLITSLYVAILFAADRASGQDLNPIKWKIKTEALPTQIGAGSKFNLQVIASIDEGWHLYSPDQPAGGPIPTRIALP